MARMFFSKTKQQQKERNVLADCFFVWFFVDICFQWQIAEQSSSMYKHSTHWWNTLSSLIFLLLRSTFAMDTLLWTWCVCVCVSALDWCFLAVVSLNRSSCFLLASFHSPIDFTSVCPLAICLKFINFYSKMFLEKNKNERNGMRKQNKKNQMARIRLVAASAAFAWLKPYHYYDYDWPSVFQVNIGIISFKYSSCVQQDNFL